MSSTAPPHLLQRMQEKKQELEHLLALRQLASHLQTHFDELSEKFDGLMQGNQGTHTQTTSLSHPLTEQTGKHTGLMARRKEKQKE